MILLVEILSFPSAPKPSYFIACQCCCVDLPESVLGFDYLNLGQRLVIHGIDCHGGECSAMTCLLPVDVDFAHFRSYVS